MRIRVNGVLKFEDCPRAYKYQYVDGIRTEVTSSNLVFGTAVHEALTGWLIAEWNGKPFDPVQHFRDEWKRRTEDQIIEYSATLNEADLIAIGEFFTGGFADVWIQSGLMVLPDEKGEPAVERRMEAQIAPGVVLSGQPDVIAMNVDGEVIVIDFKTPSASAVGPEEFDDLSDQLTGYQLLAEAHAIHLGIEEINGVGFMNLLKRKVTTSSKGKGPEILTPHVVPARSTADVEDYRQKIVWIAEDIKRGRFPKRSKMAYNSPCAMCDFSQACAKDDWEGLVHPVTHEKVDLIAAC